MTRNERNRSQMKNCISYKTGWSKRKLVSREGAVIMLYSYYSSREKQKIDNNERETVLEHKKGRGGWSLRRGKTICEAFQS